MNDPIKRRRGMIFGIALVALVLITTAVLPLLRRHAATVRCANQLHSILLVASMEWPPEHGGRLPESLLSMSNELITPRLLICPEDKEHTPAANWASFNADHCSYEIVSPGALRSDTNAVFIRCKIHGLIGYADDRLVDSTGKLVGKGVW